MHAWLAYVGIVVVPAESFHDVDLYRWWMYLATEHGFWPVLDATWVYPAGAVVPMLLPALGTTYSTVGYAIGWCLLVTVLDGVAVAALLRRGRRGAQGALWWLAFLAALGPVAMGRLDGVVAPLMVLALLAAADRPRVAAAVLTAAAWIKVAPGALLLPLAVVARRPVRDVVAPGAVVTAGVVAAVAAGGGLGNVASFLSMQEDRGIQIESVAASPWMLAHALGRTGPVVRLNQALTTWELAAWGTDATGHVLNVVLALSVGLAAGMLWWAGRRGRTGLALLPGALLVLTILVVVNKVGSPQYLSWLAPPMAVLVAQRAAHPGRWLRAAGGILLAAAALTQIVFPWGYDQLLAGHLGITLALVLRNALLVALLVAATIGLLQAGRADRPRDGTAGARADDTDDTDDTADPARTPDVLTP